MLTFNEYVWRVMATAGILCAMILIPYLIYITFPALIPLILAYLTTSLLNPFVIFLQKRFHVRFPNAVFIVYLAYLSILFFLFYLLGNKLFSESVSLIHYVQTNHLVIQSRLFAFLDSLEKTIRLLPYDLLLSLNQFLTVLFAQINNIDIVSKLGAYTWNISTAIPSFFLGLTAYFIAVFLFFFQLDLIRQKFYSFLRPTTAKKIRLVITEVKKAANGYIKAQLLLSTIPFTLSLLGLTILGARYILLISFIIAIADILPIIGAGTIILPWALIHFLQENYSFSLGLLILYLLVTVVRKVIEPKILGSSIGLSPLTMFISMWVGFKTWGLAGILLLPFILVFFKAVVKTGLINWTVKI